MVSLEEGQIAACTMIGSRLFFVEVSPASRAFGPSFAQDSVLFGGQALAPLRVVEFQFFYLGFSRQGSGQAAQQEQDQANWPFLGFRTHVGPPEIVCLE